MEDTDQAALLRAFATGLKTARGDRLVDILWIVAYNVRALAEEPAAVLHAAGELLPVLVEIIRRDSTDLGLRGAAAMTLVAFGSAVERAAWEPGGSPADQLAAVAHLRSTLLEGFGLCFERPTPIAARKAVVDALNEMALPEEDLQAVAQKVLADPAPAVRARLSRRLARTGSPARPQAGSS